jgi:hypothetical protein
MTAALGLLSGQALAATDGTLGATSTGTSLVSLSISQVFKITGLADIALGAFGTTDMTGNSDACIYTNTAGGAYHVKVTDDSGTGGFALKTAGGSTVPYTVKWNSAAGTTGNAAVTYNTDLAGTNANTTSQTCAGGKNANVAVNVLATDLTAAAAGNYSTTLSVLIEP